MSLSVEQVRQMREQIKANDAAKTAAQKKTTTQTAKTTPAAPAAKSAGTGLSVAQVAQIRSQMTAAPASTSRLQTTASTPAWTGGTRQVLGTVSADTLGKQVLADMASNTGSPVATDRQEDYEPDWNYVGSDNAPKQRAIAQGTYGSYAKAAQKVGNALAKDRQTDRFDELNQWMDESPRHREVVDLLRQKEYTTQEDKGVAPEQAVQVTGTKQRYSPGDLLKMGYTAQEINEARAYIREYDALPVTDRAARRTADATKGIAATVASVVPMAGEMTTQGVKDIRATQKNEAALDKELEGDARGKELKDRITAVDMDYNPQYTDEDLRGMGYNQSEIDTMRSRIAGTVQKTALDKDTSLGHQLYNYGRQRKAAAQAGMSPAAKTAMGVVTSAAENLAVAGVSPYLVLPVLSAQGAAESMGQDVEKGTSAGQAVGVGLAKFGAGWAINSVGVADMARSMGVDYARDTVAGKLADLVRSSKLVSGLGNSQLAANTISGGVDNAVQAFVETYADKIIDATLGGDQQAADELLQSDTFWQALQSGLTGGASGALGGAVGTGLGAMSRTLDARAGMETAAPVQVDTESRAADAAAAQRALEARAMEPGEAARQQADQAAAMQQTGNTDAAETTARKDAAPAVRSENPAVQQLAAAMEADALTGKTINLFTPNAANEANRAAFAEEYGMELPATASETRKALRTLAQQTQQQAAEVPDTNVGNNAARAENPAADPGQGAVEKAGKTVENGQGYSVSMSNDTMTVRFADGTEAVRTVDPENPRTMLFDPEQLHQQAQAESRAEIQQEAPARQQSPAEADGLRRTVGLRQQTLTEKQRAVQRTLTDWKVSKGAAETISRMVPDSIADLERYTAAASSMYRMGQMDGVKTFDKALELAGGMNNLAPNTNYVLQQPGGEQALRAAFLQGQGEVEAGTVERGALGGALTDQSTKGEGRVIWKGSDRAADDVATQVIRLNAAGTGTDAILKSVLLGPDGSPSERVKAYVDTETGRIFFGDRNGDVFGTVLHEDYHWYNALDAEGAKAVQNTALEYLAKSEGFENVDELIRDKVKDYAAQGLTYEQAAEELVADSWRGIFDSAESVTRWAEFQRAQAEKNAGKAGTIHKVMTAVKEMLNGIISRAKEALTLDPENRAALKAQRLAEAEKRALQDAYFAHAEKAMDNLRAAKENAAALKSEGAAQGVRFQLHEGKDSLVEQMNGHLDELEEMKPVATIEGTEVSFGKTRNENISNVEEFFDSIGNKVIRENFGTVELTKSGARATVQHGNSKAKQVAVAAVPEVIQKGKQIGYEQNWQGRGYDTYVFAAPVEIDGTKLYEGVIVREYTRQNGMKNFYVHEVCWTDGSYVTFDTEGNMTKKEDTPTQLPKAVRSTLADAQEVSSDTTIAQTSAKSKENNAAVQKNVRYQLAEQDELAKLRTEQQQLTKQRSALKEERSAWLNSAEVQRIEAKKKALGVFSAEGKAYRDSAEYQDYLAKRKEYNSRLAALEERDSALTEQMKEANERLQQRKDAQAKDAQRAYDAKAKEYGGNAEYRRVLAKEQFGVTEEFRRAGYILPDGQMLDFAQNDRSRDTDHREILEVFGPAEVKNGTEALNEFLLDGNVRVMAEAPGVDISADTAPTAQQLEQIRKMAEQLGGERRQFTLDISTADGRVAASKEYSGRVDADKVVREIREYYKTGELAQESSLAKFRFQLAEQASREAKKNDQRQASRDIANTAAALDTLSQFFGVTRGVKVSQDSLDGLAARWTKANASRADRVKLANEAIGNRETAQRLAQWSHRGEEGWTYAPMQDSKAAMEKAVHGLRDGIKREMENSDRAQLEWENSGLQDAIDEWLLDVNDNREREIEVLRAKIENAKQYTREDESPSWTAYVDGLNDRLAALKNGGMATLSSTELRGLRDIIDQTLHIIKTDNVVVGAAEDVMIDEFAEGVKSELTDAKGVSKKPGALGRMSRALNSYKMNTMNIERMFERLGGYTHGGYMENLGKMLNDGQRKKTKILIEGTRVFDELTGPKHEKELYHFTHDLVDIGLKDDSGKARKITHNQLAELALQLQNKQGVHHILHGGLTLENMEAKLSGDTELAKLDKATVRVGQLAVTDSEGSKLDAAALSQNEDAERRTLLEEVDKHLTDYDRAWMAAWKTLNARMTGYINETSMLLSGVKKATTENYIHINVDSDANPEQNKGIRYDNSAANPGWLNHRVNSSKPVLLVGLVQQAETSIENTAQYAGMAVPLRNAEKVLNSMQGGRMLFGTIGDVWGTPAREYMNNALADLCEVKDSRAVGDGVFAKLRSYAAAAALNANINVTLLQAASLPTAAAELGWGATGGAAVQFGKNILPWELTKIEQRMAEHGDELLAYRLRGTGTGEMASANAQKGFLGRSHDAARNSENKAVRGVTKAADKVIGLWTGGITKMDEITVAACWQGSESYVKAHPEEFAAGAEVVNSPEYWAAVNEKFEQVVEHTQPNYTTMQRTGFQRSDNAMVKALMMFSTQRQQNAQILTSAFEDYAAQGEWVKARKAAYKERPGAESKAALEEAQNAKDQAGQRVWRAVSSQVVQTAVIAALGVGVKFGLHRWQDLQDDNGDMTPWSVAWDFVRQFVKSFGSNWTGVSEAMTAVDLVTSGFTSTRSTISMNGIEVLNDVVRKMGKVYQLEAKDTSEMTEKQLDAYNAQMKETIVDMLGQFAAARGIPYANLKKQVQAVTGWMDTLANWNKEGGNFDSLPASATGQYDRLYNAYLNGDTVEAKAAIEKLNGMVEAGTIQENKMYEQMKQRLQQYEPRVTEAAQETNADRWEKRKQLVDQMTSEMQQAFGGEQSDAHDCVVKAVDAKSNELLKAEKGYDKAGSIYAGLRDAVGSGSGQSVQDEYNRLVKAGKKPSSMKNEITKAAKADYVDGSDYDREQLAEMLLALTDKDGNALYEQKNLDDWVKQAEKNAEKEAQKENEFDRYDLLK